MDLKQKSLWEQLVQTYLIESRAPERAPGTLTDALVLHKVPVSNSLFPPRASVYLKEKENACVSFFFFNLYNAKRKMQ